MSSPSVPLSSQVEPFQTKGAMLAQLFKEFKKLRAMRMRPMSNHINNAAAIVSILVEDWEEWDVTAHHAGLTGNSSSVILGKDGVLFIFFIPGYGECVVNVVLEGNATVVVKCPCFSECGIYTKENSTCKVNIAVMCQDPATVNVAVISYDSVVEVVSKKPADVVDIYGVKPEEVYQAECGKPL